MDSFSNIYRGKTVLVTGHTGFKGTWLSIWLHELGAKVVGIALDPATDRDNYVLSGIGERIIDIRGDIRDKALLKSVFDEHQPEFVFHLAAQPLVRLSYEQPVETYETNVMGTIHVLEAFRRCASARVAIMITTDKCYENKEQIWGYRESDPLGGYDPYSSSKGAAEIAIHSWRQSYFNPKDHAHHQKAVSSVRAGNVIGGGDWAKDRIIPDCIKAIESNEPITIRHPQATRPWEHVLEPLSGYLLLGEKMWQDPARFSGAWNFGPEQESIVTVWEIANKVVNDYGKGTIIDGSGSNVLHEAQLLSLDITKAKRYLDWHPTLSLDETVQLTVDWYARYKSENVYNLCLNQIRQFSEKGSYHG